MADLESLLARLITNNVDFVVVGGYAAMAHGITLQTLDVDVCIRCSAANLMKLQTALKDLHPVHRMSPQRRPLKLTKTSCRGLKNLYLDTDYGQLDCLGSIEGLGGFASVRRQSLSVILPSGPCRILKVNALIRAKLAIGRPRDMEAVLQLKAIQEQTAKPARRIRSRSRTDLSR
ncbi:MAG TPA: hypothetical protein PLE77_07115 [Kiritimatiellia bacterium]|nr:hypothetical protein [Kiritimatiellia bacterium]